MFKKAFVELCEGRILERGKAGGQRGGSEKRPGERKVVEVRSGVYWVELVIKVK